jgi:hypothetical protein
MAMSAILTVKHYTTLHYTTQLVNENGTTPRLVVSTTSLIDENGNVRNFGNQQYTFGNEKVEENGNVRNFGNQHYNFGDENR